MDTLATSKIAEILEILNDERWHTIKEIEERMKLNENQFQQIVRFLKEYRFIMVDKANKEMKIEKTAQEFLKLNTTS